MASRGVTWATSVPILVFLGLSVLELGPMYATDRQTDVRRQTKASLKAPPIRGGGIKRLLYFLYLLRHRYSSVCICMVCVCVCIGIT